MSHPALWPLLDTSVGATVGASMTMLGQTLADRRARRLARREAHEELVAREMAELREMFETQSLQLAELRGIVVAGRMATEGKRTP